MREIANGALLKWEFDSWSEFVDRAKNGKTDLPDSKRASRSNIYGKEFSGTSTFGEALDLAEKGWTEGAEIIKRKADLLQAHLPQKKMRKEIAYSVVGPGTLDMGRYIMGHPEVFMVWEDRETEDIVTSGKIISIVYNGAVSAAVSHEAILNKGATIATVIDLLEQSGFRVELDVMTSSVSWYGDESSGITEKAAVATSRRLSFITKIRIKNAEDPLELEKIAFILAHSSAHRRITFSVKEQIPVEWRKKIGFSLDSNYGIPLDIRPDTSEDVVYIPSSLLGDTYKSEEQSIVFMRELLARYGIQLGDAK